MSFRLIATINMKERVIRVWLKIVHPMSLVIALQAAQLTDATSNPKLIGLILTPRRLLKACFGYRF